MIFDSSTAYSSTASYEGVVHLGGGIQLRQPTGARPHDQSGQRSAITAGVRLANSNATRSSASGGRRTLS